MAQKRYVKVTIYAGILFLIAIVWFLNFNFIIKLGLPAVVIFGVVIKLVTDRIEKQGLFIKKRAKDAVRGARAEEVIAEKLTNLPDEYHVFNDIAFDRFNIDHVVVGPGGIFLVETKSHKGNITAKDETLLLDGKQPSKSFLNQTWSQTFQLRDYLKKHTSRDWKVKPILCFTRAFVSVREPVKGIAVVNGKYLATYLSRQRQSLSTEELQLITRILQSRQV